MKLCLILILSLLVNSAISKEKPPHIISLDWQGALLYGSEWRPARFSGLKLDAGVSVVGLLLGDVYYAFYLLPEEKRIQPAFLVGMTNASVLFNFQAAMIATGTAVSTSFRLTDRLSLDIKLGAGFPFFFEEGEDVIRDIQFPLDLWPDAALGIRIER